MADQLPAFDQPQVGFVYMTQDGDPVGPAQLLINGSRIMLTLPFLNGSGSTAERWGRESTVPSDLLFVSKDHRLALSDCAFASFERNLGSRNHGASTIRARIAAATGARVMNYALIEGLRSEIAGLAPWTRRSSIQVTHQTDDDDRIRKITVTAEADLAITTEHPLGLTLLPDFQTRHRQQGSERTVIDRVLVRTRAPELTPWEDHLRAHRLVQELVALAYWWPCGLRVLDAIRADDPATVMSGESVGEVWRPVSVPGAGRPGVAGRETMPENRQPLFVFDDIGAVGLQRWIDDYDRYGRVFWILTASLYQQHQVIEPRLLQVGTALEALGHRIADDGGRFPLATGDTFHFVDALLAVANDTNCDLRLVAGENRDIHRWTRDFNAAFKGVKHADNALPDPEVALDLADDGVALIRLWLACHLGVRRAELDRRGYLLRR